MIGFKKAEIENVSVQIRNFIKANKTCPEYITVNGNKINRSEYLRFAAYDILEIETGNKADIQIQNMNVINPTATQSMNNGTLTKQEYITRCWELVRYMDNTRQNPELHTISLGKANLNKCVSIYSWILAEYKVNGKLPDSIPISSTSYPTDGSNPSSNVPDNLKQYLVATANCQVNDPVVQSVANGLSNAQSIFNYVLGLTYDYYYNTQRGAVKTITDGIGNCTDLSHALIAIARAKGIPARYVHNSSVKFSTITTGHVWAELYVNGSWIRADASNNNNTLGNNPKDSQLQGTTTRYIELPF